jgi:Nuclease-related domain
MAMFYARTKMPEFGDVHTDIRRVLAGLPPDYHVCFGFKLRKGYDVVIIHRRGIHVIEVKNERMIVTGGPQVPMWTLRYEDGTPKNPGYENPYGQVTDCANQLKLFLQSRSNIWLSAKFEARPKSFHSRPLYVSDGCVHFADHTPSVGLI